MARRKKTIKVEEIRNLINAMLTQDCSQDAKAALSIVIEETLHRTGNYQGFKYNDVPENGDAYDWASRTDDDRYNRHYFGCGK